MASWASNRSALAAHDCCGRSEMFVECANLLLLLPLLPVE
jgi:hypothetical protein